MAGERQLLHEWRWYLVGGTLGLLVLSLFASTRDSWWDIDVKDWIGNVLPEFLGAIAIAVFVSWFLRDDDRKKYIAAMQGIRRTVGERTLPETEVQELMRGVVKSVSLLYFGTEKPAPDYAAHRSEDRPTKCGTCRSPKHEPVKDGRCTRCFDLVESWKRLESEAEESTSVRS
jgi:hypothetical protein